jgi:hypothetical protein
MLWPIGICAAADPEGRISHSERGLRRSILSETTPQPDHREKSGFAAFLVIDHESQAIRAPSGDCAWDGWAR